MKPRLSFWQIWNMSFGFMGIQFGFALQNANVSRIFQTLGAEVGNLALYWLAAPVTGLLIQPVIGHFSDKTWTKLGRRRPYFLFGAIAASMALILMPNSSELWMAVGLLWIMDASINVSMEPFRAFVGDMLPSEQRTMGFSMQSFFIGIGAIVASVLPWVMTNWLQIPNTAPENEIPPSVRYSFFIGAAVFILAILWTVLRTKEYPPEVLASFEEDKKDGMNKTTEKGTAVKAGKASVCFRSGIILLLLGIITLIPLQYLKTEKEVYILSIGLIVFGFFEIAGGLFQKLQNRVNGFAEIVNDLNSMPKTMRQLAVVQFFSWFALFAMWIYTTPAVTDHIYGATDTTSQLYQDGADWVGICFGIYNGMTILFAFLLILLARLTSRKITHMIALLTGGISFISIFFISSPGLLVVPFVGIGLAWAGILAMPYAILTGSLPANKMGIYMGIFNFFIVIPQILAASILGALVKHLFGGHAIYALVLGGISMILAGIITLFVEDKS